MEFDKQLIAGKLRRWESYLSQYSLPKWDDIPNLGLYMEQVTELLSDYLDYLPPELKNDKIISAATINNYVRKKVMPEPKKKRYYRIHIAYLIIICTLKYCLSIDTLRTIIPNSLSEVEIKDVYDSFVEMQKASSKHFVEEIRIAAGHILDHENTENAVENTSELITFCAINGFYSKLLAEKLLVLEGKTLLDGGSIEKISD